MGKAALVLVFGTVLFIGLSQMTSKETQEEVSDVQIKFNEYTLASEIALSAYEIAERRAKSISGTADSILAALNGHSGSTTGNYQGGTYSYSATKQSNNMITISAHGYYGAERHEIRKSMRLGSGSAPPETSWNYGCNATGANFVEITGIGLGNGSALMNNGSSVTLLDTTSIEYMKAQVGGRTDRLDTVSFLTSNGQSVTLPDPDTTGFNNMGYFQADLDPASWVSVNVTNRYKNGARGFVVYAHRNIPTPTFSEGRYLDIRMYHYGHNETFIIPAASAPRTVYVDFVMYDKADDGRTVIMEIEAGTLSATRTIGMPNMDEELSIETLALHNVPGTVTNIVVSIYSNDSLYWKMAHVYTDGCN